MHMLAGLFIDSGQSLNERTNEQTHTYTHTHRRILVRYLMRKIKFTWYFIALEETRIRLFSTERIHDECQCERRFGCMSRVVGANLRVKNASLRPQAYWAIRFNDQLTWNTRSVFNPKGSAWRVLTAWRSGALHLEGHTGTLRWSPWLSSTTFDTVRDRKEYLGSGISGLWSSVYFFSQVYFKRQTNHNEFTRLKFLRPGQVSVTSSNVMFDKIVRRI